MNCQTGICVRVEIEECRVKIMKLIRFLYHLYR